MLNIMINNYVIGLIQKILEKEENQTIVFKEKFELKKSELVYVKIVEKNNIFIKLKDFSEKIENLSFVELTKLIYFINKTIS